MSDQASVTWNDFVGDCARQVIEGKLTTQFLRAEIKRLPYIPKDIATDFQDEVKSACINLGSPLAGSYALDLEIRAASNRVVQLLRLHSREESAA